MTPEARRVLRERISLGVNIVAMLVSLTMAFVSIRSMQRCREQAEECRWLVQQAEKLQ